MITSHGTFSTAEPMSLYAKSTDDKPTVKFKGTKIENGSTIYEMDTKKVYMYDSENDLWIEQ